MRLDRTNARFVRNESGATSTDWTVLLAATCGLAVIIGLAIERDTAALGDETNLALAASNRTLGGAVSDVEPTCPLVVSEGRITRWTSGATCDSDGVSCDPEIHHSITSYLMEDGTEWTAQVEQADGEPPHIRWFDHNGTEVSEPCFPS